MLPENNRFTQPTQNLLLSLAPIMLVLGPPAARRAFSGRLVRNCKRCSTGFALPASREQRWYRACWRRPPSSVPDEPRAPVPACVVGSRQETGDNPWAMLVMAVRTDQPAVRFGTDEGQSSAKVERFSLRRPLDPRRRRPHREEAAFTRLAPDRGLGGCEAGSSVCHF